MAYPFVFSHWIGRPHPTYYLLLDGDVIDSENSAGDYSHKVAVAEGSHVFTLFLRYHPDNATTYIKIPFFCSEDSAYLNVYYTIGEYDSQDPEADTYTLPALSLILSRT